MKLAFEKCAPVAIRKFKGKDTIVSCLPLLTNTLDQDEFDYSFEKLQKIVSKSSHIREKNVNTFGESNETNVGTQSALEAQFFSF